MVVAKEDEVPFVEELTEEEYAQEVNISNVYGYFVTPQHSHLPQP